MALLEPSVAYVAERFAIAKSRAAIFVGIAMLAVGFVCLYDMDFLNFLDGGLTAPITLPLAALILVLFVGWRLDKKIIDGELQDGDRKLGAFLLLLIRYVAPLMIAIIFVAGIRDKYFPDLF